MHFRERVLVALAALAFLGAVLSLTPRKNPEGDPTTTAWRRLGREDPAPEIGCREPQCSAEAIDLYCFEHEVYLPRGDTEQSRSPWGIVGAAAACALFWTAAEYETSVPLYLAFVGALAAILRLTLRRLPLARNVGQTLWVTAAVAVPAFLYAGDWMRRALVVAVGLVALGSWAVHLAVEVAYRTPKRDRWIVTGCAAALGAAVAISAAYAGARYLPDELDFRGGAPDRLLPWVVFGATAGCFLATLGAALGKGRGAAHLNTSQLLSKPALPKRLEIPKPTTAGGSGGGLVNIVTRPIRLCCLSTVRVAAHMVERAVNFVRQCFHVVVTAIVTVLNLMWSSRLLALRYLADAGAQWLRLLSSVLGLAFGAGRRSARLTLLPILASGTAVGAAWAGAAAQRDYLDDGSLQDAGTAVAWCVLALLATTLVWSAWSGLPIGRAMYSSARTVGQIVAVALGAQAIGGWLLGLTGMLGYGSVRVGWVTGTATVIFGVFFIWSMLRRGEAGVSVSRAT